ncbi:hypothetical protein BDZ91DRAFT_843825 [Kalaharituber pfeilii]|nr:hypothetical protein BDZ91DRAFT_843825 [Kalaharituber pfeilii]
MYSEFVLRISPGLSYLDLFLEAKGLAEMKEMDRNLDGVPAAGKGGRMQIVREWVLPVDLREKWATRKWAEALDSILAEPAGLEDPRDGEN